MNIKVIIIVFFSALVYAIIRYNIAGEIPWTDIPIYIVNKAVAFTIIILLIINTRYYHKQEFEKFNVYIKFIKGLIIVHVLLSLSVLTEHYYPKLYSDCRLNIFGNLSILFGVLTFAYVFTNHFKMKNYVVYLLICLHLIFIGYKGFYDIKNWNGMMPPISLLCITMVIIILLINLFQKSGKITR